MRVSLSFLLIFLLLISCSKKNYEPDEHKRKIRYERFSSENRIEEEIMSDLRFNKQLEGSASKTHVREYEKRSTFSDIKKSPSNFNGYPNDNYEIWVIERVVAIRKAPSDFQVACHVLNMQNGQDLLLPIYETTVQADINGLLAEVSVQQKYSNPYNKKIEIEYIFPLPENAAISDFIMTIGDRKIRGVIREKEEAKEIYEQALKEGYRAALLTQERDNVFKQKIANVEPYKHIQVNIQYFYNLNLKDGKYQFVFPTVVGPRYFPNADNNNNGSDLKSTSISYTNKNIDHHVNLNIKVSGGIKKENITCKTHKLLTTKMENGVVVINGEKLMPNKDIIIEFEPDKKDYASQLLIQKTKRGEYFALSLIPSEKPDENQKKLKQEIVFVVDCSGSMSGWPLEQAVNMIKYSLEKLNEEDFFQIIQFSNTAKKFSREPVAVTFDNKRNARAYLSELKSSGGTEMIPGIKAALNYPISERERIVVFITDGYIGNEGEILKEVYANIGKVKIFSFGVGNSINRYLLKELAIAGKGGVAYITEDKEVKEEVGLFFDRLAKPLMQDVKIDWKDWEVGDVYPKVIPVLYHGMPKMVTGKIIKRGLETPQIVSMKNGEKYSAEINQMNFKDIENGSLEKIWARNQIAMNSRLLDSTDHQEDAKKEILNISLEYQVLSNLSAFLAVDATGPVADKSKNVTVPSASLLPENK